MAIRAKRPCRKCGTLTENKAGLCDVHLEDKKNQIRVFDKQRGSAHQRGYTQRWTEYSRAYRRQHPLCVICEKEGRLQISEVVDHIIPHRGDYGLMWNAENHQALCKRHHDIKTATEDGGLGNPRG